MRDTARCERVLERGGDVLLARNIGEANGPPLAIEDLGQFNPRPYCFGSPDLPPLREPDRTGILGWRVVLSI